MLRRQPATKKTRNKKKKPAASAAAHSHQILIQKCCPNICPPPQQQRRWPRPRQRQRPRQRPITQRPFFLSFHPGTQLGSTRLAVQQFHFNMFLAEPRSPRLQTDLGSLQLSKSILNFFCSPPPPHPPLFRNPLAIVVVVLYSRTLLVFYPQVFLFFVVAVPRAGSWGRSSSTAQQKQGQKTEGKRIFL